jgi:hypothetical protein
MACLPPNDWSSIYTLLPLHFNFCRTTLKNEAVGSEPGAAFFRPANANYRSPLDHAAQALLRSARKADTELFLESSRMETGAAV